MRWMIAGLLAVGLIFVAILAFWPSQPARNAPPAGFSPGLPAWLIGLLPDPPAAKPRAAPPQALAMGNRWSGRFFAEDGKLGVVRFHLLSGPELRVTIHVPGSPEAVLCIAGPGVLASCDQAGKDQRGSIVVRDRDADLILEAPRGPVTFAVND
ncbi:hypothetical protein GC209_01240 [bacterium]|nr:hypothetical protein [bacterium]